ncbi:hypothetical protein ACS3UN_12945 [Oscillospiraceae bacterium LTW-04]|nr:hypothetical protein RBH76_00755 [Oscillospiraceae bacterium MB24-C1]
MNLAFELVPDLATHIAPHHRFRMSLIKAGTEISTTCGSDCYNYNAMVLPGQPIAATGRNATHNYEPDLKGLKGIGGVAVEVPLLEDGDFENLVVNIDTNLILSQEILQSFYSLRCHIDDRTFLLPLKRQLLRVSWDGLGIFNIDVGSICNIIAKKHTA